MKKKGVACKQFKLLYFPKPGSCSGSRYNCGYLVHGSMSTLSMIPVSMPLRPVTGIALRGSYRHQNRLILKSNSRVVGISSNALIRIYENSMFFRCCQVIKMRGLGLMNDGKKINYLYKLYSLIYILNI